MRRVLLAEDSEFQRFLLKRVLHLAGYDVQLAVDGSDALKIWSTASFDLVITDLVMPNSDGLELIREIRSRQSAVKIIAVSGDTGLNSGHFLEVAKALGADYCLLKPFTLAEVLETVVLALPASTMAATARQALRQSPSGSSLGS